MMAFSESHLAQYPIEEVKKYALTDKHGTIIGVREDAPAAFKEAYEQDKKIKNRAALQGIDL